MPNSITTITKYIPMLDEVYKFDSRTAMLDAPEILVRETADAGTVMFAKTSMVGLGDYSRSSGFAAGDVTLTWESRTLRYDRGRTFSIDAMDDLETVGLAFGTLGAEFLRTQVVPEIDAVRFSTYADKAGHVETGTLDASGVDAAIVAGETAMAEKEVNIAGAYLFMTPTVYGYIKTSSSWTRTLVPSENPNRNFGSYDEMPVITVPQGRFIDGITLNNGSSTSTGGYARTSQTSEDFTGDGSTTEFTFTTSTFPKRLDKVTVDGTATTAYTYTPSTGKVKFTTAPANTKAIKCYYAKGRDINFMIISPASVMQIVKHGKIRVFDPDVNQTADAYKIDYRIYHDAWVLDNKADGIYCHEKAAD